MSSLKPATVEHLRRYASDNVDAWSGHRVLRVAPDELLALIERGDPTPLDRAELIETILDATTDESSPYPHIADWVARDIAEAVANLLTT
jgi:hypothetical protein